ncbi:MAG TPA: protein kinase, partial [Anaerolineales bacterium]|nr:protein kinase [Anaerolineales bacterium]
VLLKCFCMPNITGKLLGKVRVDMYLARGGMADVYIGTHTTLQRAVAIKFLKGDLQDEPELRERFEREARVIAMLRHPNIVQVYDFDTYENQPYIVMEYIPGTSLSAYLRELHKNNARLDITQINKILGKLANALKYAHDNDVIHRDIKPANILLTSRSNPAAPGKPLPDDTEPIITDFGLVRFTQASKQTSTGMISGTPAYMSPEQARGDRVDTRTDVYSLGITVYEMLAGRVPFETDSTMSLLHKQIHDPPPSIEGISPDLQEVMNRALAKNPDERFATPLEFAEAFQTAINMTSEAATLLFSAPSVLPSKTTPAARTNLNSGTNKLRIPISIGMVSVLITLLGIFYASRAMLPVPTAPAADTALQNSEPMIDPAHASSADPVGLLRFQDGTAQADQISLSTNGFALPPAGNQYEAWLLEDDNEQRISLGIIQFGQENEGTLTYVDPRGMNLIGLYHALEITTEPNPDNNPNPSNIVTFSATLPEDGFTHVRHLLFSFPGTPNKIGFIRGLDATTISIDDLANEMLRAHQAQDDADMSLQAEKMLNAIVGDKSLDYKDWNGDGNTDDAGDGYGLLLNGNNLGYIQGTFTHANLALTSPDATDNMLVHGEHVKIAATNIGEWTSQLRDLLVNILQAPAGSDVEGTIRQVVALSNQIRNGIDINGNEKIEAIPGEGGVVTADQHAYYMADISIFP